MIISFILSSLSQTLRLVDTISLISYHQSHFSCEYTCRLNNAVNNGDITTFSIIPVCGWWCFCFDFCTQHRPSRSTPSSRGCTCLASTAQGYVPHSIESSYPLISHSNVFLPSIVFSSPPHQTCCYCSRIYIAHTLEKPQLLELNHHSITEQPNIGIIPHFPGSFSALTCCTWSMPSQLHFGTGKRRQREKRSPDQIRTVAWV